MEVMLPQATNEIPATTADFIMTVSLFEKFQKEDYNGEGNYIQANLFYREILFQAQRLGEGVR